MVDALRRSHSERYTQQACLVSSGTKNHHRNAGGNPINSRRVAGGGTTNKPWPTTLARRPYLPKEETQEWEIQKITCGNTTPSPQKSKLWWLTRTSYSQVINRLLD